MEKFEKLLRPSVKPLFNVRRPKVDESGSRCFKGGDYAAADFGKFALSTCNTSDLLLLVRDLALGDGRRSSKSTREASRR